VVAALVEGAEIKRALAEGSTTAIVAVARQLTSALLAGHTLLLVGNGGSAADAQHVAAEFIGRFQVERRALPAIALTTDTSVLTSLANDYGVESIFERQVEALARPGDVLLAFSTSGASPNVLRAVAAARAAGVVTVGLTGALPGPLGAACDFILAVPSSSTPRIQEAHIAICHILCDAVEQAVSSS
jgi:D-sedoheptulose 7-phosphate isomerase